MKVNKIGIVILMSLIIFSGCNKKAYATSNEVKNTENPAPIPVETEESKKLKKLDLVLSQMSPRFREEITISDKISFLNDLEEVLEFEKSYESEGNFPLYFLIDKKHYAPDGYEPNDLIPLVKNDDFNINRNDLSLRSDAFDSLTVMSREAQKDGIKLLVSSTYRSYEYQKKLFQRWVDIDGLEEAERESARAGTSQHQLGVAVDFGSIDDSFAETKMGKWMYQNGARFGWSLSFPHDYEDITGYRWESWHFRWIGKKACDFQKKYFLDVQQYMLEFIDAWKNA